MSKLQTDLLASSQTSPLSRVLSWITDEFWVNNSDQAPMTLKREGEQLNHQDVQGIACSLKLCLNLLQLDCISGKSIFLSSHRLGQPWNCAQSRSTLWQRVTLIWFLYLRPPQNMIFVLIVALVKIGSNFSQFGANFFRWRHIWSGPVHIHKKPARHPDVCESCPKPAAGQQIDRSQMSDDILQQILTAVNGLAGQVKAVSADVSSLRNQVNHLQEQQR